MCGGSHLMKAETRSLAQELERETLKLGILQKLQGKRLKPTELLPMFSDPTKARRAMESLLDSGLIVAEEGLHLRIQP